MNASQKFIVLDNYTAYDMYINGSEPYMKDNISVV